MNSLEGDTKVSLEEKAGVFGISSSLIIFQNIQMAMALGIIFFVITIKIKKLLKWKE